MSMRMDGSVPLVRLTREGVQDNLHRGAVVVIDDSGKELLAFGVSRTHAYIRSAAKPIQAIPVVFSGAMEAFGLDEADLAIICGSHQGGPEQVAQVRSILSKAGVSEQFLKSGKGIEDNCSGKHAGMLAVCKHEGLDLGGYLDVEHPHQRRITEMIAKVCDIPVTDIHIGIDGCGAPIHCLPIRNMALGYARLSRPEKHFGKEIVEAMVRITRAMASHAGGHTGEPDYAGVLGGERLLTKGGGNGVYCAGVVGKGIGFAMKVEDGSSVPLKPIFTELMRRMKVISEAEAATFAERFWTKVVNRRGAEVGSVELLI